MVLRRPLHTYDDDGSHRAVLPPLPKVQTLVDPTPDLPSERVLESHPKGQKTRNPQLLHHREAIQAWVLEEHQEGESLLLGRFPCKNLPEQHLDGQTTGRPKKDSQISLPSRRVGSGSKQQGTTGPLLPSQRPSAQKGPP